MSRTEALSFLLLYLFVCSCAYPGSVMASAVSEPHSANALWIEPSSTTLANLGDEFNLTVWLNASELTFAWQVKLVFNSSYLNITRVGYTNGVKSDFFSDHSTITVTPVIMNSENYVICGETLLSGDQRASRWGSLIWLEARLIGSPQTGQVNFSFSEPYGVDTFVLTPYLETVGLEEIDGSVVYISNTMFRDILITATIIGIILIILIMIMKKRRTRKDE
jgi:hypothetical protein